MAVIAPEDLRERIGARLRDLMKKRRISFTDLAKEAGVSRGHLYGIANGKTSPTGDTLTKLAAALEVDPVELVRPYRKTRP